MRVLVTDGNNRAALAVTRSLGRLGHHVIVGERRAPALAQTSRYCAARLTYPDPAVHPDGFVDVLADEVERRQVDVLLPIADVTTFLVTRHGSRFGRCAVPFAPPATIDRAADKIDVLCTATRLGVPVPASIVAHSADEVPEALDYPVVVKPQRSRVSTAAGWRSTGVSHAADRDELLRDLRARHPYEFPVMLQERIVGPGIGVFACYHRGRPVALFSHRRLREKPPWGGVSVLSESVPLPQPATEYATRLLTELGWHGVAMVEFKHDVADGQPKLMEINGRFWGSLQLAIDSGVDFPAILMDTLTPAGPAAQDSYRVGVRSRWLWGDVDALLLTLVSRGGPRGRERRRLRALREFMRFWDRNLHYENPKWDDPKPWLFETAHRIRPGGSPAAGLVAGRPAPGAARAAPAAGVVPQARPGAAGAGARPRPTAAIVRTLADLGLDRNAWNHLVAKSPTNTVFQTHEWATSWWDTFGPGLEPHFVRVQQGTDTVAVAPLILRTDHWNERILRFLGDGRADYSDVLAPADRPDLLDSTLDAVLGSPRWEVVELANVPSGSPTVSAVRQAAQRAGLPVLVTEQFRCPTLRIEGHEDEARAIAGKASLRRRVRAFERDGALSCRHLTAAADVVPRLDAFFDQHVARWQDTRTPSLFLDGRNKAFYRALAGRVADAGWLRFSVVEFEGHPIAFHYGFVYDRVVTWYKPSFDPGYAARSPGLVLLRFLLDDAVAQGAREFDFTVGNEPFKARFTNDARMTVQIQVFRSAMRLGVERGLRAVKSAAHLGAPQ